MKLLSRILLLAALLASAQLASARTYVLAAGVSKYNIEGIEQNIDLARPGKDAVSFSNIMKTQTKDVTTLTSKNATRDNILAVLSAICNRAEAGDRIVFFFSGHGAEGFFLANDGPVSYGELSELFSSTAATEIFCYIDACFAGSVAEDLKSTDKDLVFFLACRPDEVSTDGFDWVGAGFLTQALMKGMQGKADTDGDRQVTVLELFKYVYNDVVQRVDQSNRFINRGDGKQFSQHPQLIAAKKSYDLVVTSW